jgi:hypothetical protein
MVNINEKESSLKFYGLGLSFTPPCLCREHYIYRRVGMEGGGCWDNLTGYRPFKTATPICMHVQVAHVD